MTEVLNKKDLVELIAENKGITKVKATDAIEAVLGGIKEVLAEHKSVKIAGFGKFESVFKPAHKAADNLNGGKIVEVPDHFAYRAKLSKTIA